MASRKISTVSDSVTLLGGSMEPVGLGSNERNQNNNNYHRWTKPHFPQIKIVIDEPEPVPGDTMALHPLLVRRHGPLTGKKGKSTGGKSFLTIYDDGTARGDGARTRTNATRNSSSPYNVVQRYQRPVTDRGHRGRYQGDYLDEDEEDYGIDTDGYRRTRLHPGPGNEEDDDREEDEEEDDDHNDDDDDDEDEEEEDDDDDVDEDDEENGGNYHRFDRFPFGLALHRL